MISIRRRLVIVLISLIILIGSITVFLSYKDAHHEVGELFDAQLAQSARVLDALFLHQINKANVTSSELENIQNIIDHITVLDDPGYFGLTKEEEVESTLYERKIAFQIWDASSNLIVHSASAPQTPLSVISLKDKLLGYFNENIKGKRWRVFSIKTDDKRYLMQVGEQYEIRDELTKDISTQLIRTSVISIPILIVFIWLAISKSLSPLGRIAAEVTKRNKENFNSLDIENTPIEIAPLTKSINNLLRRLQIAFEKEQQFTDDAAHELRTPLAALKTQAQVALAAHSDTEKTHAINKIIEGVDRASHLVNQMLVIARLEKYSKNNENINLHYFVLEILEQYKLQIDKKYLKVTIDGSLDVTVTSETNGLTILLNNLIDNAIRYARSQSTVYISIHKNAKISLNIENSAETIPVDELSRIFDRFYRVPGTGVPGCGLGLAISKQVAEMLGIKLSIVNNVDGSGVISKLEW